MNAITTINTPEILKPGPRVMRASSEGEASLDWAPRLVPLFSMPFGPQETTVRAGSAMAIVRPGYEEDPLGIVTEMYRPVDHRAVAADVAALTTGTLRADGAMIDGHGYHAVHAFRVESVVQQIIASRPLFSRLSLVHDHTGCGSIRASVVTYLGRDLVIGSRNYTRRIHVGAGSRDVGVGDRARWLTVLDAMVETANLQQGAIADVVRKASTLTMTEEFATIFEAGGIAVERTRDDAKTIVARTPLHVVAEYHRASKGRQITWGVWSRRLEGDALACLEKITGIQLPDQLFRR